MKDSKLAELQHKIKDERAPIAYSITKHQVSILTRIVDELVEWAHSQKFAHKVTLDLVDEKIKAMVSDGLIHSYQAGKIFQAFKMIFEVTVVNKYSPAEYRAKLDEQTAQ